MFQFLLAEKLGIVEVDRLADSLTRAEVEDWMAYGFVIGWFDNVKELKPEIHEQHEESKAEMERIYG